MEVPEQVIEACAEIAHEANRIYSASIGDHSHRPWAEAPEWQKNSARAGVSLAIDGATPKELHDSWCRAKRAEGWTYGEVKDAEAKTHPCLVEYDALPPAQLQKDALYGAVVRAMARAVRVGAAAQESAHDA